MRLEKVSFDYRWHVGSAKVRNKETIGPVVFKRTKATATTADEGRSGDREASQ